MTYETFGEFRQDYEVASLGAKAFHGDITQTKSVDPNVGWMAYSHARKPQLGFHLFGRHISSAELAPLRSNAGPVPALNSGPILQDTPPQLQGISFSPYDKFKENFGLINDLDDGSILKMGGDKWNFTVNDSWLLAGVHSELVFYACSPIHRMNLVHTKYILTITGRELLGLAAFGYRQVTGHAALGTAFECADPAKARAARLTDYQVAVSEANTMQAAMAAYRNAGFNIGM